MSNLPAIPNPLSANFTVAKDVAVAILDSSSEAYKAAIRKNQQIAELNARIEAIEIENAELKYDVSELKPKTRALKKELNQCKVNLKNVRSVVEGCYE